MKIYFNILDQLLKTIWNQKSYCSNFKSFSVKDINIRLALLQTHLTGSYEQLALTFIKS